MTISLPNDLQRSVEAAVYNGQFTSVDEAIAEAVRLLLCKLRESQPHDKPSDNASNAGLGLIGALRDDADLLDQAVEHAMKVREERPWRLNPGE